jgi:hypothetical protein
MAVGKLGLTDNERALQVQLVRVNGRDEGRPYPATEKHPSKARFPMHSY